MIKVGDRFKLNCGSIAVVLEYHNSRSVDVKTNTGYECNVISNKLLSGNVKDKLAKTTLGIGYIGIGKYNTYHKSNKAWNNMMSRCYRDNNSVNSVCSKWHNFQNFAKWFEENYIESYHIDKDLKIPGNHEYSEENCIFIPESVNTFFKYTLVKRCLPYGVKRYGKGFSSSTQRGSSIIRLTILEAKNDFWNNKHKEMIKLSIKFKEFKNIITNYFEWLFNEKYLQEV